MQKLGCRRQTLPDRTLHTRLIEDTLLPFSLPFEISLGVTASIALLIADPRNPAFVTHGVADILLACMLAIACGYEDGDDLDHLRTDPGFKLA